MKSAVLWIVVLLALAGCYAAQVDVVMGPGSELSIDRNIVTGGEKDYKPDISLPVIP